MELGSLIGLIAGAVFMFLAMFMGAGYNFVLLGAFIDYPSMMIVFGGTFSALLIGNPLPTVINGLKTFKKVTKKQEISATQGIIKIVELANLARKEGLLALEAAVAEVEDDFLKTGIVLVVDGTDPELVRSILETELAYVETRHKDVRAVWDYMGAMAPAWGMIGTLIGLVLMLLDLSDPDSIGPKMAVALLTTMYGSIIANYIALPVANKLKIFSSEEMLIKEVLIEGILSIQAGENPRIIEEKLKSFLPPALRKEIGDQDGGE